MDLEELYYGVKIGDEIPPLEKEAVLEGYRTPELFGSFELAAKQDKALEKAKELGVNAIHTSKIFGGVFMLQFVSEMITNWLPNPKGWVQGGKVFAKFIGLVRFNEIITCKGQVKDKMVKDSRKYLVCDVWVENVTGNKVVIGEATISF